VDVRRCQRRPPIRCTTAHRVLLRLPRTTPHSRARAPPSQRAPTQQQTPPFMGGGAFSYSAIRRAALSGSPDPRAVAPSVRVGAADNLQRHRTVYTCRAPRVKAY